MTLTIGLTIGDSQTGATTLAKIGSGTLVLSASNNYTGGTMVEAGTLEVMNFNALPGGSSLAVGAGARTSSAWRASCSGCRRRASGAGAGNPCAAQRGWNRCGSSSLAEEKEGWEFGDWDWVTLSPLARRLYSAGRGEGQGVRAI